MIFRQSCFLLLLVVTALPAMSQDSLVDHADLCAFFLRQRDFDAARPHCEAAKTQRLTTYGEMDSTYNAYRDLLALIYVETRETELALEELKGSAGYIKLQ